jgi:4-amino-4-deoxy-L-arabinose transferase-like glycosyltransferase
MSALLTQRGLEREPVAAWEKAFLAVLLVLALALRLIALDSGLWFDEIDTLLHQARQPLAHTLTTYDSRNNHYLFSILAKLSVSIFGDHAWSLRLPAALFGVGSVWALWWFARRVASRRVALLATALLTCSYHHVHFSQNARGYTGLLFMTLVGSAFFVDMLHSRGGPGGLRLALGYGLSMALATATHPMAVMAVAGHGVVWLSLLATSARRDVGAARWFPGWGFCFSVVFSLLLYAPILPPFLALIAEPPRLAAKTEWKDPVWMLTETMRGLAQGLPGGWVALAAAGLVGAMGVWSFARQSLAVLAILLLGSMLTAITIVAMKFNLWPRFFFLFAGYFVLIGSRGVLAWLQILLPRGKSRWASTAVGVLVVGASAWTLPGTWAPKQDYAGAWALVDSSRAPADAVVTADMTTYVLGEYLKVDTLDVERPQDLKAIEAAHPRTWFLYTFPTRLRAVHPELWEYLQADYTEVRTFWGSIGGGEVVVMRRD